MKNINIKGIIKGILISLVPHIGCIFFAVLLLTGVTVGSGFVTKFFSNRFVFPVSILLSFILVAIYSYFYMKKSCCTNKIRHISLMLVSIVFVNTLLFFVVFPSITNLKSVNTIVVDNLSELKIQIDIPCSGHSSLIAYELKKAGVADVRFDDPDIFDLRYDSSKITKEQIEQLDLFKDFKIKNIL